MCKVYILYSSKLNGYYVGYTTDLTARVDQHNQSFYSGSFTKRASDWVVYFEIPCLHKTQAIKIEQHIKRMKSRKYIENLKLYPGIAEKLILLYQ